MPILSITERGQLTLRREILLHLGLKPGQKVEASLLPNGGVELRAFVRNGSIAAFVGSLKEHSPPQAVTIEEMNEAIASSQSGAFGEA